MSESTDGPATDEERRMGEHLRGHLTDGRWHDTCPWCLRRREKGGTGIVLADQYLERLVLTAAVTERLRANLGIYGDHLSTCLVRQPNVAVVGRSRCNCGYFDAVMDGAST